MEINKDDYIIAVWFVSFRQYDWMCTVKRSENGGYEGEHRFRYYVDDKVHDSDDEKTFHQFSMENKISESEVIDRVRNVAKSVIVVASEDALINDEVPIGGGSEKFFEELSKRDWASITVIRKEPQN